VQKAQVTVLATLPTKGTEKAPPKQTISGMHLR
jgi:hypothetical protein